MATSATFSGAPTSTAARLDPELVRLVQRAVPAARVQRAQVLGADDCAAPTQATAKAVGYGVVIRIDADVAGVAKSFVLHGASPNQFGHDRRADRAAEMLLAADTFALVPRHTRALDVGTFRTDGTSVSLLDSGEFYLLTDYAPGHPYAEDLRRIATTARAEPEDLQRVTRLADYLATLHAERRQEPFAYARSLRDLFGSGEGIFGIVDGYGGGCPAAEAARLERIERACLQWRWKLKQRAPRLSRIHGDFHPFNVLFDAQSELHVLDTSRGSLGDPADDVACMAINYPFFALEAPLSWSRAFVGLWREFWRRYLTQSRDHELLDVVAPYLAWRALVLACPAWYPSLGAPNRDRLLTFAENALAAERFEPEAAESVFG
jgi:hypothetical protein